MLWPHHSTVFISAAFRISLLKTTVATDDHPAYGVDDTIHYCAAFRIPLRDAIYGIRSTDAKTFENKYNGSINNNDNNNNTGKE